jgi:hypothetical protein
MADPARLDKVSVKLDLGFLSMETEWVTDPRERQVAWELYVELVSRIATQPLDPDEGLAREALDSLHDLFAITREVLRSAGPDVGMQERSVGYLALGVLNRGLRPFLSRWHPRLLQWEHARAPGLSAVDHERAWPLDIALRGELEALRSKMWEYARALSEIAGLRKRRS